ncbi:hypothetical protein BH11BAC4_BH11BAC4_14100 [soil metagenome]
MMKYFSISFLFLFVLMQKPAAQTCTTLGQTPETAFPVCAADTFRQTSVPVCGGTTLIAPGCTGATLSDLNPYYYKFTCFSAGTLGFTIKPVNGNDDYDWQLFDITNHAASDIFSNNSLFVACNWSGESGNTGASSAGNSLIVCATVTGQPYRPLFSSMPTLTAGHDYLLMISHFLGSDQSGYGLSFDGGSAVIVDPLDPHLTSASASCDATKINIKLNKKMKCKTIAVDGSDFSINAPGINITGATGNNCSIRFDMDTLTLSLSGPLPPGNYNVTIKNGTDGNTLNDICDRSIPANESVPLTIFPILPTPMDSLTKPTCAPQTLELVFRKPIRCSSVAADGSDFSVIGTYPVAVTGATGNCVGGLTSKIFVQLSAPMQVAGSFIIRLNRGTDGNTILDDCTQETPAGSFIPFTVKDTVNADFNYSIIYGCQLNTVQYLHNGSNGVNSWLWNFDNIRTSNLQNPIIGYTTFDQKITTLIVSNGVCSDTATRTIFFDNYIDVRFEVTSLVCPGDQAFIKNNTIGNIVNWEWDLGNGNTSNIKYPLPQTYQVRTPTYSAVIKVIATNNYGCKDTAIQLVRVINNCFIAVPSAFTPNGDGLNDYLYPLNAYKAADLTFSVYNRFGQRLFYTRDWTNKWDGTFKGQGADPGTYVWVLSYINTDTKKRVEQKGTTVLIR